MKMFSTTPVASCIVNLPIHDISRGATGRTAHT